MRAVLKLVEKTEPVFWLNLNFAEYPIFLPVRNPETDSYFVEKSWARDEEERYYELQPGKSGLPTADDFQILVFLLHLAQEKGSRHYRIRTMNSLLTKLKGKKNGNANYSHYKIRILQALDRWMEVRFKFVNTFYEKGSVSRSTEYKHVLEYGYKEHSPKNSFIKSFTDFHVDFHKFFWEENKECKGKTIMYPLTPSMEMKSALSQNLHLYLYKWRNKMFDERFFERSFSDLISNLGLQNYKNIHRPNIFIKKLDSAMKEVGPLLQVKHTCDVKAKKVYFSLF